MSIYSGGGDGSSECDTRPCVPRRTSIEAYETIRDNGMLTRQRWDIYNCLYHHGPLTCNEVVQLLIRNSGYDEVTGRHISNATLTWLRDSGCVYESYEGPCSTGNHFNAIHWDVTERLPEKVEKKESLKRLIFDVFKKYGDHLPDCDSRRNGRLFKCICGFDKTLADLEAIMRIAR